MEFITEKQQIHLQKMALLESKSVIDRLLIRRDDLTDFDKQDLNKALKEINNVLNIS